MFLYEEALKKRRDVKRKRDFQLNKKEKTKNVLLIYLIVELRE